MQKSNVVSPQQYQMQQQVITTQPGMQAPSAPGSVWMPLPKSIPGVPQGLEYLSFLDHVMIYQIKELIEIVTDFETKNKYVLKNANDQQAYYAFEESGCCERQCCGSQRGFVMHIIDNFKREVLTIRREFNCCGGICHGCIACIGCFQHECVIESPSHGLLGTVRQRCACCASSFDICDAEGNNILQIDGPCCCSMMCCNDKEFPIKTIGNEEIGAITKKWGGCFKETYTDADTFAVNFPMNLDVKTKAVLLGATFLIDFMEFEKTNSSSNSIGSQKKLINLPAPKAVRNRVSTSIE